MNRVIQFFTHLAYHFHEVDQGFLAAYLNEEERLLFQQMKKSEKIHSLLVAKGVQKERRDPLFIKASLLHDVGKILRPLTMLEKTMAVILQAMGVEQLPRVQKWPFMASYLTHGQRGADLLVEQGFFSKKSLYELLIRHHHDKPERLRAIPGIDSDFLQMVHLLKKMDDRY